MDSAKSNTSSLRPCHGSASDDFDSYTNSTDGSALRPPPPSSSSRHNLLLDSQLPTRLEFTDFTSTLAPGGLLWPAQHPDRSVTAKKRTRASRRAPTTVLTTDTMNFSAMVQEFTGIPSAPSAAARPRLDLLQCLYSDPPPPPPPASYLHRLASLSPNSWDQYARLNSHLQNPTFTSQSPVRAKNIRRPATAVPPTGNETRPQGDRASSSPEFANTKAEEGRASTGGFVDFE
ncbi:uncharacterized protein LOC121993644 [Zingiber officinale]|uniref:VQ domain-containing protein n=1 Tax=Zingiber officinale TaxID=94328 RepID=A0A8J5KW74_ZINOF|nr:uncharacterized protein LOC121993644 [Zingiber officinale]KAG6498519.1 hypothetical protein ZIOFF_038239 [Zingiber officinale]